MKRRDFIKTSMVISAFGTRLPLMAVGRKQRQLGRTSQWESDRIVILIKLNGGNDGLNFLYLLLEKAPGCLRHEGELLMEHGFDQQASLQRMLENCTDFQEPEFLDDLEGRPRLLRLVSKSAGAR